MSPLVASTPRTAPAAPKHLPRPRDGGQALPLVLVALVLGGVLAAGLVRVAAAAARRSMAQSAADAAALAGAADGPAAARAVAAANGATVRSYREVGPDVVVEVVRRGAVARARSRWQSSPGAPSGPGGSDPPAIP